MEHTVGTLLAAAVPRLNTTGSARLDAELLLAHILRCQRTTLYLDRERAVGADLAARFDSLVAARADGCPLAYLTGRAEFWSLTLEIERSVLVPRPETELVVEVGLGCQLPSSTPIVADLGTGSGAVACAFAHERPQAIVVATDRSAAACGIAQRNAARLGLDGIRVVGANWLAPFHAASFDLILANPPYIGTAEQPELAPGLAFEPAMALFAGTDGLADLRHIVADARRVLRAGGQLVLEHGHAQGPAVRALCAEHGFETCATLRDLAGHERVTRATR
jgi:release factor glutamine methyltransferase